MNSIPQDDTPQKRCTGLCQRELPATADFFNRRGSGLKPRCKQCTREEAKVYDAAHKAERREYHETHLEAARINSKRYTEKHPEKRRATVRQSYETHREETLAWHRQHYRNNLEREHARNRRYRENNPEKIRAIGRGYRENNPGKELARQRRYYKTYPEKGVARSQKYAALKKGLEGTLTVPQIQAKLKAQKYSCYYAACGHAPFKRRKNGTYIYHLEHTIPVSRPEFVPRHDADYVVLACPHCNQSKGAKLPHEWAEGGRLF